MYQLTITNLCQILKSAKYIWTIPLECASFEWHVLPYYVQTFSWQFEANHIPNYFLKESFRQVCVIQVSRQVSDPRYNTLSLACPPMVFNAMSFRRSYPKAPSISMASRKEMVLAHFHAMRKDSTSPWLYIHPRSFQHCSICWHTKAHIVPCICLKLHVISKMHVPCRHQKVLTMLRPNRHVMRPM